MIESRPQAIPTSLWVAGCVCQSRLCNASLTTVICIAQPPTHPMTCRLLCCFSLWTTVPVFACGRDPRAHSVSTHLLVLHHDAWPCGQFGRWARRLGVPATHDDGFHQAQLENYNQDTVLRSQRVVSYHKFEKVLNHETKEWRVETAANVAEYYRRFPDLRHVSGVGIAKVHDASEL